MTDQLGVQPCPMTPGFHTQMERRQFLWHWALYYRHRDGRWEIIARDVALRRKHAVAAAGSWQRIYMRRQGLLNL